MVGFINSLDLVNLDYIPPKGKNKLLDDIKSLQSNIKHLTWKTQIIAQGDFTQKIDFMGDFSVSFNK